MTRNCRAACILLLALLVGLLHWAADAALAPRLNGGATSYLAEIIEPGLVLFHRAAFLAWCLAAGGLIVVCLERTRRQDAAIRENERSLAVTLQSIGDAVIATDREGKVQRMNRVAESLTGWPENEARGKPLREVFRIINEESRQAVESPVDKVLREGRIVGLANHTLLIARDGTERPIADSGAPIRDEAGVISGIVLVFRDVTEECRSRRALAASEERMQLALEAINDGLFDWEIPSGRCYFSPTVYTMLGYEPGEFAASFENWRDRLHPDDRETALRHLMDYVEKRTGAYHVEYRLRRKNGDYTWILGRGRVVSFDADGRAKRMVGTQTDITARKESEEALRANRGLLQTTLDAAPICIGLTIDRVLIWCNEWMARMLGYTREELAGLPARALYPTEEEYEFVGRVKHGQVRQRGIGEAETRWRRKDGGVVDIFLRSAAIDPGDWSKGLIFTASDISDRKRAASILRDQRDTAIALSAATDLEEGLRLCLDAAIRTGGMDCGGIYLTDPETGGVDLACHAGLSPGFVESVRHFPSDSPSARVVHAGRPVYTQHQALIDTLHSGNPPEILCAIAVIPFLYERKVIGCVNVASHAAGEVPTAARDSLETLAAQIGGAIARLRAEAALRESEAKLRQAEKMEAIGKLAGGIAHDFNNQLSGIIGYGEILQSKADNPKIREYAGLILRTADRAADLTGQLLAFSHKGKRRTVPVDLHRLIGEVVSILEHSLDKRIRILQELTASPCITTGDPTQLQNALLNLAINARDAMPKGGTLRFTTRHAAPAQPPGGMPGEIDWIEVGVSDTGVGIPPEIRSRIFEPFFTTKREGEGTGMGLAAVYGTVTNHHGAIEVESTPGRGATFRLFLPAGGIPEKTPAASPAAGRAAPGKAHILIVDDEPLIRGVLREMLEGFGYRIAACQNGAEAVEYFRRSGKDIDLVLLDIMMPEMSGPETLQALRRINPEVRVVFASGFALDAQARESMQADDIPFVPKPFRTAQLARVIAAALGC